MSFSQLSPISCVMLLCAFRANVNPGGVTATIRSSVRGFGCW